MLVPCSPNGSGSGLSDFARAIHMTPAGFLGPAASNCSEASLGLIGMGVGVGVELPNMGPGFLETSLQGSCWVAKRGRGIAPRIVQFPRPRKPGRAMDNGKTAT